jgi:hypothetical protein
MDADTDPAPRSVAADRDEEPDADPDRTTTAAIQEHHFQRPVVSPVRPDVRTATPTG